MSGARPRLLIATSNRGKLAEFRQLLPEEIEICSLADLGLPSPEENGETYEEIAVDKAIVAATRGGLLALADDSGIEVEALGDAPGVRSARFAGPEANDAANRTKLLNQLSAVAPDGRAARFRCVVALADPSGLIATAEGRCDGSIALSEVGDRGFGYDPLFLLADGRTIAQLEPDEKNAVSHRGNAVRAILPRLLAALSARTSTKGSEEPCQA